MFTLFYSYYNQPHMIEVHKAAWASHRHAVQYAIVDDGSPLFITTDIHPRCTIYRIEKDIPWNVSGARNLGFHMAKTPWVMTADIDHVVSAQALNRIMTLKMDNPNVAYIFRRRRLRGGVIKKDTIVNILMNRQRYFELGGFDEDFTGSYGSEDTFFRRLLRHRGVNIVRRPDIVLDWHREGATPGLNRDCTQNRALIGKKTALLRANQYRNGPILRFSWSEQNAGSAVPESDSTSMVPPIDSPTQPWSSWRIERHSLF